MGSALSPLMAELFMSHIESLIQSHPLFNKIIFLRRYVDDIFAVFRGDEAELTPFIFMLNSLHPSLKFTSEIEIDNAIPFLDLKLTKFNNKIKFSIYHKPSSTDVTIPYDSNHPYSQKFAVFHSYFNRLFNIPLDRSEFNSELNLIKRIAKNNSFPPNLINKIYYKHLNKSLNKNLLTRDKPLFKFYSLPFWGSLSYKLKNIFKPFNINISFKTQHSLKKYLCNSKDRIPITDRPGVYSITCSTEGCGAVYVGQTGRKFSIRLKEHSNEIVKALNQNLSPSKVKSNFSRHVHINKHLFTPETSTKFLHICNKGNRLDLLEILEINKVLNDSDVDCLNDQIQHSSTNFFNSLYLTK